MPLRAVARTSRRPLRLLGETVRPTRAAGGGAGAPGRSGSVRAGVLGVNDGLISSFSLVMGVAGGTGDHDFILLAGVAGMLAGAFSMAASEYVSMRSQRDLFEHAVEQQERELRERPEEKRELLGSLYRAKGLSDEQADQVAARLISDPEVALDTIARERLGLDPTELGSPWSASASSFVAFAGGALVPILPFAAGAGGTAAVLSAALSGGALAAVGGALAALSGRGALWGGLRMLLVGGAAAAVTFGVGRIVGTYIA